jgi:hypothetical protein
MHGMLQLQSCRGNMLRRLTIDARAVLACSLAAVIQPYMQFELLNASFKCQCQGLPKSYSHNVGRRGQSRQ